MRTVFLLLLFLISCGGKEPTAVAVADVVPDPVEAADTVLPVIVKTIAKPAYVDSIVEKMILGQRYQFVHRKEADDLVSLRIVHLPDSAVCFDDFLRLYGGDCNAHSDLVGKYELRRDSFFFYSFNTYTETWDIRYPSSSDSGSIETWVFRRNGSMVRVSIQEAKEGDALLETIRKKLEREIDAR